MHKASFTSIICTWDGIFHPRIVLSLRESSGKSPLKWWIAFKIPFSAAYRSIIAFCSSVSFKYGLCFPLASIIMVVTSLFALQWHYYPPFHSKSHLDLEVVNSRILPALDCAPLFLKLYYQNLKMFHWKSFTFTNWSVKSVKLVHLEQFEHNYGIWLQQQPIMQY